MNRTTLNQWIAAMLDLVHVRRGKGGTGRVVPIGPAAVELDLRSDLRAGFYSNDLLDNLGHPSARDIVPELQHLEIGKWIPMSPTGPSDVIALRVGAFGIDQWLLWRKPDSTWAWRLSDPGDGTTRLVTRLHATYQWSRPLTALLGVALMEFGDFAMMRRMLLGIKERAETLAKHPDL